MNKRIQRIYVDSSVPSAMFDEDDHPEKTRAFWQAVIDEKFRIIASDVLDEEMESAPQNVQEFYERLPESQIERIVSTKESNELAALYIAQNVVGESNLDDCRHIALATIANADVIVSWNLRHIVNENRIPKYNGVNTAQGYKAISIQTPYDFMTTNKPTEASK